MFWGWILLQELNYSPKKSEVGYKILSLSIREYFDGNMTLLHLWVSHDPRCLHLSLLKLPTPAHVFSVPIYIFFYLERQIKEALFCSHLGPNHTNRFLLLLYVRLDTRYRIGEALEPCFPQKPFSFFPDLGAYKPVLLDFISLRFPDMT
jgi:hypothetical protein